MRIEDYGYTMECYPHFEDKYVVNFYKHKSLINSIYIMYEDTKSLQQSFPKYKLIAGHSSFYIDATHTRVGVGTVAPNHKLNISVQVTPPFPLIRI